MLVDAAERGGEGLWAGAGLAVLAGFQTKAGARVVWAGGVDMFGDAFAGVGVGANKKTKRASASAGAGAGGGNGNGNGNTLLALDVAAWAFQERGMLRIEGVSHHRVGETQARATYTTNDVVVRIKTSDFTHSWSIDEHPLSPSPFILLYFHEIGLFPQCNKV